MVGFKFFEPFWNVGQLQVGSASGSRARRPSDVDANCVCGRIFF